MWLVRCCQTADWSGLTYVGRAQYQKVKILEALMPECFVYLKYLFLPVLLSSTGGCLFPQTTSCLSSAGSNWCFCAGKDKCAHFNISDSADAKRSEKMRLIIFRWGGGLCLFTSLVTTLPLLLRARFGSASPPFPSDFLRGDEVTTLGNAKSSNILLGQLSCFWGFCNSTPRAKESL